VLVTLSPEESAQMRPPRALYPAPFKIGNAFGKPGQVELQRKVLRTAIEYLNQLVMPGAHTEIEFPEYEK
jgi:hypothetical protein